MVSGDQHAIRVRARWDGGELTMLWSACATAASVPWAENTTMVTGGPSSTTRPISCHDAGWSVRARVTGAAAPCRRVYSTRKVWTSQTVMPLESTTKRDPSAVDKGQTRVALSSVGTYLEQRRWT